MRLAVISTVALASLFTNIRGENVQCTMVPFQTKEGINGHCCVFYKNTNKVFPKEEVTRQILENSNLTLNQDDKVVFNNTDSRRKSDVSSRRGEKEDSASDKVVFDDGNHQIKNVKKEEKEKNITLENKNAFDVPDLCAEGTQRTHSGKCEEPFN